MTMPNERNAFEALCELAARENWCWNIVCTTCGHTHFRYGLQQLARGKHPDRSDWRVTRNDPVLRRGGEPTDLGPLPPLWDWPLEDQSALVEVLSKASLKVISGCARFPDWLGYMGLGLCYSEDAERNLRAVTQAWVPQVLEMLPETSPSQPFFKNILGSSVQVLRWRDLEKIEFDLMRFGRPRQLPGTGF